MSLAGTQYAVLWANSPEAETEDDYVDGCFDSMLEGAEHANPIAQEIGVDWIFVRRRKEIDDETEAETTTPWKTFKGHVPSEALARYRENGSW
jgi:hypothetical protein